MKQAIKEINNKLENYKAALEKSFLYFMLYSFLGWIYEVFLEVVIYDWGYSDRGVLFGPYCIIYGTGALVLLIVLKRLRQKRITLGQVSITPLIVFVSIIAITTLLELATSYIMEWRTGNWMWDYTRVAFNFQGRIALNPSLRFGLGGLVILYVIQPLFERLTNRLSPKLLSVISGLLAIIFLTDCAFYIFK